MKVAIPHYQNQVAPCFEATATITIFTVRRNKVVERTRFTLQSREALDRVRLLRDQGVTTLICGGLQASFEDLLRASGIRVFSWVSGCVGELLDLYLEGQLAVGAGRPTNDREHAQVEHLRVSNVAKEKTKKGMSRLP